MPKPFDATMKNLIRNHAADWLAFVGVPIVEPPEVLDTDLSAVSASADTLIRVGDRVIHIDIQTGPDENLARRMLLYNVLAHYHTRLPVQSTVVLLRSNATRSNLQDRVAYGELQFGFDLIKVWEWPAEEFLTGGIGLLPMAVIARPPAGRTREQALPKWVDRIAERVEAEAPRGRRHRVVVVHPRRYARVADPDSKDLSRSICDERIGRIRHHHGRGSRQPNARCDNYSRKIAVRHTLSGAGGPVAGN